MLRFDCQACGACCCNTARNIRDGTREYIEIGSRDELGKRHKQLLKQLAVRNARGEHHMRLVGEEQRCIALDGDIGEGVHCTIYRLRPSGCRRVESGDDECLNARRLHGLPLTLPRR